MAILRANNNTLSSVSETNLKALPTIYDINKNTLAYSDYNYSVKNIKRNRDATKQKKRLVETFYQA